MLVSVVAESNVARDADYAETEVDLSDAKCPAPKGTIQASGYYVNVVDEELAEKEYGSKFAIDFKPYWSSDRRRTWSFRFESAEDRDKYATQFRAARWACSAPLNRDPVMREAFKAAYRQTRYALNVWGYFSIYKTEEQMMGELVVDKCERELMQPVYAKIPSGAGSGAIRRQVVKILDTTVGAAVAAQWKATDAAITTAKPKVDEAAEKNLGPVVDLQLELSGKIVSAVSEIVTPVVATITQPVFGPLVKALGAPIADSFARIITIMSEKLTETFEAGPELNKKLDKLERQCFYYWNHMHDAYKIVHRLTRAGDNSGPGVGAKVMAALMEIVVAMNPEMTMWRLEYAIERAIRDIAVRMVYSFKSLVAEGSPANAETLDLVKAMAVHDALAKSGETLSNILYGTVESKLDSEIRPKVVTPLEPLKAMIVPPLDILVDVDDLAGGVIEGMVSAVVDGIVWPAVRGPDFKVLEDLAPAGVTVSEDLKAAAKEVFVAMEMEKPIPTPAEARDLAAKGGAGGAAAGAGGSDAGTTKAPVTDEEAGKKAGEAAAASSAAPGETKPATAPEVPKGAATAAAEVEEAATATEAKPAESEEA